VAVAGDTVVVGAYQEDSNATGVNGNQADNSASNADAAYVFTGFAPQPVLGDANCDGDLNAADVASFAQALIDPAGYAAAFPTCMPDDWEPNDDGLLDGDDVGPFVTLLLGP
jgi:hypothetical protein